MRNDQAQFIVFKQEVWYNIIMEPTPSFLQDLARHSAQALNKELGLPLEYDQTKSNRCDRLTLDVMEALRNRGVFVRRELHMDEDENWHYVLSHGHDEPSETGLITSLNPWQGRAYGGNILHAPRHEVIDTLLANGMPDSFVALHSLKTIVKQHDEAKHPFVK